MTLVQFAFVILFNNIRLTSVVCLGSKYSRRSNASTPLRAVNKRARKPSVQRPTADRRVALHRFLALVCVP